VVELAGIAQGADQAVMSFNVGQVGSDRCAKGLGRFRRLAAGEQVEATVKERVGGVIIGHGWFQDKGRACLEFGCMLEEVFGGGGRNEESHSVFDNRDDDAAADGVHRLLQVKNKRVSWHKMHIA
jgi:hypothetical protein